MQYVGIWRKEHAYKVLLIREIFDDDDVPEMSFNNSDAVDLEEEEENEWEEVLNEQMIG